MYDVPGIPLGLTSANLFGNNWEANPCPICISPSLLFRKLSPPALLKAAEGFSKTGAEPHCGGRIYQRLFFLSVVVEGGCDSVSLTPSGAAWALCLWHSPASSSTSRCRISRHPGHGADHRGRDHHERILENSR